MIGTNTPPISTHLSWYIDTSSPVSLASGKAEISSPCKQIQAIHVVYTYIIEMCQHVCAFQKLLCLKEYTNIYSISYVGMQSNS